MWYEEECHVKPKGKRIHAEVRERQESIISGQSSEGN